MYSIFDIGLCLDTNGQISCIFGMVILQLDNSLDDLDLYSSSQGDKKA